MRWERGTAEKTDGLTRQYLSKQKSMEHLTQHDGIRIPAKLKQPAPQAARLPYPEECYARLRSVLQCKLDIKQHRR